MYSLPSSSQICEPRPLWIKSGVPPTLRKARTGLFTPPTRCAWASWKSCRERSAFIFQLLNKLEDLFLDDVPGLAVGGQVGMLNGVSYAPVFYPFARRQSRAGLGLGAHGD